ncbi:hypothetical protein D3C81_1926980 [compost metagenome]
MDVERVAFEITDIPAERIAATRQFIGVARLGIHLDADTMHCFQRAGVETRRRHAAELQP